MVLKRAEAAARYVLAANNNIHSSMALFQIN